ncbi:MAG: YfiR family protein [Armatimonadetes bacterium]|nr:YfiR family protein [Armatimonadota bacterium]
MMFHLSSAIPTPSLLRLAVGASILTGLTAASAAAQENEYSVKAAFLINFLKFIDWPGGSGPYVIEVAGKNPFGSTLDKMVENRTINGRKVVVQYGHSSGLTPSILFVPASESEHFGDYLQYQSKPIVVVGESAGFASKYGVINFVRDHDRVAFEINARRAKSSGVKVSSRLLQLAKIVD